MEGFGIAPGSERLWVVLTAAFAGLIVGGLLHLVTLGALRQGGKMSRVLLVLAAMLTVLALGCLQLGLSEAVAFLELGALVALIAGLVGLVSFILFDLLLARAGVGVPPILRDLVAVAASALITLALLRALGFNVLGLVTTSAVLTAVVGLALQATLANVFGGLALQLDRSIGQGDWVRVGNETGRMVEIGWRATQLLTMDGSTIIIPNGELVASHLVNLSRPTPSVRRTIEVGFHYRHPPNTVRNVLVRAVRDVPGVLPNPAPECQPANFAESAVVYGVRFWITDLERALAIEGEVRSRIWYAARRAGIEIPFPIRTLLRPRLEPAPQLNSEDARIALLAQVPLLASLSDTERRQVALTMQHMEFASGETIVTQGEGGDSLYIIQRGDVGVYLTIDRATRELATLRAGDVFGEMSLLTGEPRAASCVAHGDVVCQVIGREAFQRLASANPDVAVALSAHVAARRVELEASREGLTIAARTRRTTEEQDRLLPRIREFLGVS